MTEEHCTLNEQAEVRAYSAGGRSFSITLGSLSRGCLVTHDEAVVGEVGGDDRGARPAAGRSLPRAEAPTAAHAQTAAPR